MDDEAFKALQTRVVRLANQTAQATEELMAEMDRREAGEDCTVTPIRPGDEA